jgi:hypothetical protein
MGEQSTHETLMRPTGKAHSSLTCAGGFKQNSGHLLFFWVSVHGGKLFTSYVMERNRSNTGQLQSFAPSWEFQRTSCGNFSLEPTEAREHCGDEQHQCKLGVRVYFPPSHHSTCAPAFSAGTEQP